ncbi:hypothetical protein VDGE_20144 [Verticillium dahliae]|uniref:MARVEL domain-containing protein n=1 Tax=Verticillium dahliae TaxID=27337 RepID=A0A444S0X5_VERDA|nr:hypothetical protein VDGE_20144 [Verticillium dahliae]
MAINLMLPLRVVQAFLAMAVLVLSAYVANWYNVSTLTASPPQINFLIVSPLISLLSIVYLEVVPRYAPRASHPWVAMACEFINTLFYFAGFIALSVFLGRLRFCRGSVCGAARADAVSAAAQFVAWSASAALTGKIVFKGGLRRKAAPGPVPAPSGLAPPPPVKQEAYA